MNPEVSVGVSPKGSTTARISHFPKKPQMTHDPHPFHIVGECQECCDTSEALRMGYPDHVEPYCETLGCANNAGVS